MKFYSYENKNYVKAISLENVRSIQIHEGLNKSAIRFSVGVMYYDGKEEFLRGMGEEEVRKVYKEILDLLNK